MRNASEFNCSKCNMVVRTRRRNKMSNCCVRCRSEDLWQEYKAVEKANLCTLIPDNTSRVNILRKEACCLLSKILQPDHHHHHLTN